MKNSASKGRQSLTANAVKYAKEFGFDLDLTILKLLSKDTKTGEEIALNKISGELKKAITDKLQEEVRNQKWQGETTTARWEDEDQGLKECYMWLKEWKAAPTHTVAKIGELQCNVTSCMS